MVQMNYHEAVNNAPQWNAAYCYPEGFMRWWAQFAIGQIEIMTTPNQVQFLAGVADNFLRRVLIGRSHVQQVPQWYGETVGFWKGDVAGRLDRERPGLDAVALDVRIQQFPGDRSKSSRRRNDADGSFAGLTVETTFYDPEAFVAPLRNTIRWNRTAGLDHPTQRYTFIECLSNIKQRQRQADPAHHRRRRLHRLLRPAVGAELGQAGGGLGKARADAPRNTGPRVTR